MKTGHALGALSSVKSCAHHSSGSRILTSGHGGLASYGPDYFAQGVQAAGLVAKILRGARPSDVPVEGADRIELAVNLKTAELIGITLPRKVMLRAETFRR